MNNTLSNGIRESNVDDLLRRHFRREMPQPWPECAAVDDSAAPVLLPRRRSWFRAYGRIAVAAAAVLILVGYLALAGMFPSNQGSSGLQFDRTGTIGSKPKQRVPTPRGGEAYLWEETIPGERPTIIINVQEIKGPTKR